MLLISEKVSGVLRTRTENRPLSFVKLSYILEIDIIGVIDMINRTVRIIHILLCAVIICWLSGCNNVIANNSSNNSISSVNISSYNAEKTQDGFGYIIYNDGVKITECLKYDEQIIVPEQIEGKPVTVIGDDAFYQHKNMVSITLPDSVTSIEGAPFYRCYSLAKINISANVDFIGDESFFRCSALTEILVDDDNHNYCDIDGVLFNKDKTVLIQYPEGNTANRYEIPTSVTSIQEAAFGYHPRHLKELKFGPNLVDFPDYNMFVFPDDIILIVEPESKAEQYAKKHELNYKYE